ncbi:MAG: response regulator [Pseudomonadota bacterium]
MIDKKALREKVRHLKLLYVEDEPPLREQGKIFFNKFFNLVETANNGKDGLALFNLKAFDIIITDVNMPKMYGDEMVSKIIDLAEKKQQTIFTVILTATVVEDEVTGKYDLFLLKPIEFEQMFQILRKIEKRFQL